MKILDGSDVAEILQEYISNAPEVVKEAWTIRERSYMALIAEVARLASKVRDATASQVLEMGKEAPKKGIPRGGAL